MKAELFSQIFPEIYITNIGLPLYDCESAGYPFLFFAFYYPYLITITMQLTRYLNWNYIIQLFFSEMSFKNAYLEWKSANINYNCIHNYKTLIFYPKNKSTQQTGISILYLVQEIEWMNINWNEWFEQNSEHFSLIIMS